MKPESSISSWASSLLQKIFGPTGQSAEAEPRAGHYDAWAFVNRVMRDHHFTPGAQ